MPRVARVANVAPNKNVIDATEQKIGQDGVVGLPSTGDARLEKPDLQVVDGPNALEKAAELAFMEEPVTVEVLSTAENEEALVPIHVNGRTQLFPRGQEITVKRKYVEGLGRAKPVGYRAEEYMNASGDKDYRLHKKTGLRYPFRVTRDDNPKGKDWIKKLLAQAD